MKFHFVRLLRVGMCSWFPRVLAYRHSFNNFMAAVFVNKMAKSDATLLQGLQLYSFVTSHRQDY